MYYMYIIILFNTHIYMTMYNTYIIILFNILEYMTMYNMYIIIIILCTCTCNHAQYVFYYIIILLYYSIHLYI